MTIVFKKIKVIWFLSISSCRQKKSLSLSLILVNFNFLQVRCENIVFFKNLDRIKSKISLLYNKFKNVKKKTCWSQKMTSIDFFF